MPAHRTKENQGIVATESRHTVEGMARGKKKKKKPPKKKAPHKKRETAACGSACLRAAAPPLLFASPLALLSGGCAASLPRALVGGWRRPLALSSLLSIKQLTILSVTVTSHKLICSPLDFVSARHPKGPLSKATGFLHILP